MDTTPPTIPAEPEASMTPEIGPTSRYDRLVVRWVAGVALVLALVVAGVVVWAIQPTGKFALRPGSVKDTTAVISVDGAEFFDPDGEIGFTTVSLESDVTNWELRSYEGDPTITIVPAEVINGDRTDEERRKDNLAQMEQSKDVATVVALQYLGLAGEPTGSGALVIGLAEGAAAEGTLVPTDVIIEANGAPIEFSDELVEQILTLAPGDPIDLTVQRFEGEVEDVSVVLGSAPDDDTLPRLGIEVTTFELSAEFDVEVNIDSGDVSGPSAGLAFTLGIIDVLTPGELTAGNMVATTGTINPDGTVGPVGGVAQKAVAAREAGVDVFIVPSSEYEEALTESGDMELVIADTLDEAVKALESLGGEGTTLNELALDN